MSSKISWWACIGSAEILWIAFDSSALYCIAIVQQRHHPEAKAFIARKTAEGKIPREARRALKRHLANALYRRLDTAYHPSNESLDIRRIEPFIQNDWAYGRAYASLAERCQHLPTWLNLQLPTTTRLPQPPTARSRARRAARVAVGK